MKRLWKGVVVCAYTFIACVVTLMSGCQSLTPTRVPPLAEEIGYTIPNWKGWTTTGINEAVYKIEVQKVDVLRVMIDLVNQPALAAREQLIDWYSMAMSAGVFGGIPLALRKVPRGYKKEGEPEGPPATTPDSH